MSSDCRVLVLGGSGFIGSHIVDNLIKNNKYIVTVFDRALEQFREPLESVEYICGEFGNRGLLEEVLTKGFDVVIHLISSTVPKTSNDDPIFDIQSNLIETIALLDLCNKYKVKKIIFGSSGGTIYGIPNTVPITEYHQTQPICSYGIVKLAIEKYLYMYSYLYGLSYVSARFSNPYGERQRRGAIQGLIPVVLEKALVDETIEIWGDGNIVRDFIYIGDVAEFITSAIENDIHGVFNVSSARGMSVKQILDISSKILNKTISVKYSDPRGFDVKKIILDNEKAHTEANWTPKIDIETGMKNVVHWLKKNY